MTRATAILAAVLTVSTGTLFSAETRGDAARGERLFTEFLCIKCHSVGGRGGSSAPSLPVRRDAPFTPAAMAGAMWSHAAKMWQAADRAGIRIPAFSEQQAADLHAFVAGVSAPADGAVDKARGRGVYEAKLCASCHDEPMMGAPSLSGQAGRFSAFRMMSALSTHGRGMLSRMAARHTDWQILSSREMGDLIAYLNSK